MLKWRGNIVKLYAYLGQTKKEHPVIDTCNSRFTNSDIVKNNNTKATSNRMSVTILRENLRFISAPVVVKLVVEKGCGTKHKISNKDSKQRNKYQLINYNQLISKSLCLNLKNKKVMHYI